MLDRDTPVDRRMQRFVSSVSLRRASQSVNEFGCTPLAMLGLINYCVNSAPYIV